MAEVVIALGANIGNRRANLRRALVLLEPAVRILAVSALYESAPVGVRDQPPFLNAACRGETALVPLELLQRLQRIEWALGRRPGRRWGPRPLDLDLLYYDDLQIATPRLTLPHPRIGERAFVLRPLADVAPDRRALDREPTSTAPDDVVRVAAPDWVVG